MRFGEIIKKAWHITWHYKWLWVLGMFAGITGASGGGGGGGNSSSYGRSFGSGSGTGTGAADVPDFSAFADQLQQWLPFILIALVLLVLVGIAFAVLAIGARGGLVWAVDEIESGRRPRLGEAWNAGFSRFWSIFGLGLLLQLPIVLAGLTLAAVIMVPIFGPLLRGGEPDPATVLAPMCGVLAIGVPLLLVASLILGVMYITGVRFIMLFGMGATHAAGESWRALRARLGDHALMYVISLGLSIAASLAFAIPVVMVSLATIVPAVVGATSRSWGVVIAMISVFMVLIVALGFAYSAVWGTFTSAMWTVFFRRLTGREVLAPIPQPGFPAPAPAQPYPQPSAAPPPQPAVQQPTVQPTAPPQWQPQPPAQPPIAPEPPVAPPMYVPPAAPEGPPPAQPAPPAQDGPDA